MICFLNVVSFFILHVHFASVLGAEPELALVYVIYRHGDRTPGPLTYPNDPYINNTYYPVGRGGLTNRGKLRSYQLGKFLRARYNDFLGAIYTPEVMESRTSDLDRTKMSIELINSGLYPPAPIQQWNCKLPWQPIPYVYSPMSEDILINPQACSSAYIAESNRVRNSTEVQKKLAQFDGLMTTLEKLTGETIKDTLTLFFIYYGIEAQLAANMTLPEWFYGIYDEFVKRVIFELELMSYTDVLKRKYGGTLLRKITDDVAKYANGTLIKGRKVFQYSGHAANIATLQIALGVFKPHLPAYASAMIFEVGALNGDFFIKVIYYTGIPAKLITQRIPGCDVWCPLPTFLKLLKPVIATDEDLICG